MADVSTPEIVSSEADAALVILDLCIGWVHSAALRSIMQLDVPHILATHATPPNMAMTAEQLLQHMDATCPSPRSLERLLRLLTMKGLFAEHITSDGNTRRFSLTPLSRCLVPGEGTQRNLALHLTLSPEYSATLEHLSDSVLKSTQPFTRAHGINQFEYMRTHPAFLEAFKNGMNDLSSQIISKMLLQYHGFDSVGKLVDVGGSSGVILATIVEKYPHIHGINFDLPEVVATNPNFPGIEQVGGNMFEKVPNGCDAIFMKGILHDWSDEECLKLLTNCYNALPSAGGKLIMLDMILPRETPLEASTPIQTKVVCTFDVLMQIHCEKGRERTAIELEGLVKQAGFNSLHVVTEVTGSLFHVMEAHK